jgi:hypothetical protein
MLRHQLKFSSRRIAIPDQIKPASVIFVAGEAKSRRRSFYLTA